MNRYITRVELHDASQDDYDKLHEEMLKQKFFKYIVDDTTRIKYELPTAEYHSTAQAHLNVSDVISLAEYAAKTTGRKFSILTTKSAGIRWLGLKEIR